MILIEIPDNSNCAAVELRVFHDVEPAQPAGQVRLTRPGNGNGQAGVRDGGSPQWYDVTGWTADDHPCPAWLQKVDDSGDGVAFLLHGGDAGVRLRPAHARQPWNRGASRQWGEPFLIMGDRADVRLEVPAPAGPFDSSPGHGRGLSLRMSPKERSSSRSPGLAGGAPQREDAHG